ncbi:unnamed protein product [Closterium sp. Yama58-4]|nr:unnamed protein product [Closterium sp. Yama58-4]
MCPLSYQCTVSHLDKLFTSSSCPPSPRFAAQLSFVPSLSPAPSPNYAQDFPFLYALLAFPPFFSLSSSSLPADPLLSQPISGYSSCSLTFPIIAPPLLFPLSSPSPSSNPSLSPAPLSLQQRLKLAAGAADGVAYLHSFTVPIIHRDLKPGNILVGPHSLAKIADFGLLKLLSHADGGDERTRVAGTPGYLDPDYNRTHVVSDKSDVYRYAALMLLVLLELLTGLLPIFAHFCLSPPSPPTSLLWTHVQLRGGSAGAADGAQGSSGGHRQPHQRLGSAEGAAVRAGRAQGPHTDRLSSHSLAPPSLHLLQAAQRVQQYELGELKDPTLDAPEDAIVDLADVTLDCLKMPASLLSNHRRPSLALPSSPMLQAAQKVQKYELGELKNSTMEAPEDAIVDLADIALDCLKMPASRRPSMRDVARRLHGMLARYCADDGADACEASPRVETGRAFGGGSGGGGENSTTGLFDSSLWSEGPIE